VQDEGILKKAGIEGATIFAITVPVESVVLTAIQVARRLNPRVHIIARCIYISGGLQAHRLGANETIVAEEMAAREFVHRFEAGISETK
jgi:voltage-gated potassium channel Kch